MEETFSVDMTCASFLTRWNGRPLSLKSELFQLLLLPAYQILSSSVLWPLHNRVLSASQSRLFNGIDAKLTLLHTGAKSNLRDKVLVK